MNCACPIGNPQHGRPTVLVVEGEILLRMTVAEEFRKRGFNVAEAANEDEALSIIHSGIPIHLMLADLPSPEHDRLALAETIRTAHPDAKIVIASTSQASNEHGDHIDGFFKKPYDVAKLAEFINTLLNQ